MSQRATRLTCLAVLLAACWGIGLHHCVDLHTLYRVARLIGEDPHAVYAGAHPGRWFYGPVSLVFIRPLALWSTFDSARLVWLLVQSVAFAAFWLFLEKLFPFLSRRLGAWLGIWIVAINGLHTNFQSGNIQLILVTTLMGAELLTRSDRAERQVAAGVLCALAAAVKVFPAFIAVYYIFVKNRRVTAGLVVGAMLSVLLPLVCYGPTMTEMFFRGFITNVTTYGKDNAYNVGPDLQSLPALLSRWGLAPLTTALTLVLSAGLFLVARRKQSEAPTAWWALALALTALLNPSSRPHYFVFYIPAFCALLELALTVPSRIALAVAAGVTVACTHTIIGRDWNVEMEWMRVPTAAVVVLCLALVAQLARRPACSP